MTVALDGWEASEVAFPATVRGEALLTDQPSGAAALLSLPAQFYMARPAHRHIATAAEATLIARDALFHQVLARVAAITPHTVELPGIVGGAVGLTYQVVIVGPSGVSKSATAKVAADLLPAPPEVVDLLPVGSGEGLVEVLFEMVDEENDAGRTVKVKRQTKHRAVVFVDEGTALMETADRSASTILSTLRSAWTHATIGNANASADRRRILHGEAYVYGVAVAMQPALAAPLLSPQAIAAGTPQRLLWASAVDATLPDTPPPHPGPLPWQPPTPGDLAGHEVRRRGWVRHQLNVHPAIAAEVRARRLAVQRGEAVLEPLDAHRDLARLKVAALVALLDGRLDLNLEDWELAGTVLDTSDAVRAATLAEVAAVAAISEEGKVARRIRTEVAVEDDAARRSLARATRSAARAVRKHTDENHHKGQGCTRRCVTQAVASRDRDHVTVDHIVDEAVAAELLTVTDDRFRPGRVAP